MTLSDITKDIQLTDKENLVIQYLYAKLASYFGETYSDIECIDIAKDLKIDVKTVKGIVGSLVKKGILETYNTGTGYDVINFVKQEFLEWKKA